MAPGQKKGPPRGQPEKQRPASAAAKRDSLRQVYESLAVLVPAIDRRFRTVMAEEKIRILRRDKAIALITISDR